MIILINIIGLALLVLMNGFFVSAEFSMVKVRDTRIETMVLEGNKKAKYVQTIINNLDEYLSACQLGITLASLGLGWIGEPAIAEVLTPVLRYFNLSEILIHSVSVAIAFSFITALHIILGELAPKSLAILDAEKVTMFTCRPLIAFNKIMFPIIWLFNETARLVLKALGKQQVGEHEAAHTDEEIRILVEESYKHGLIDQTELTLVDNIFDFSETQVRGIMVPRTDMICFYIEDSFDKIIETALEEQLTRYPVCGEDKDDILGFIHIKDLFRLGLKGEEKDVRGIIRKIITVPESMSISVLLKKFQKEKEHMAIVIDEYGGTAGLVTAEDILEEIVGEIQDEFDEESIAIKQLDQNTYSIDGKVSVEEINELLELKIELEGIDTIGGWFYSKLENPPEINQKVQYENYEFIITKLDNLRILRLLVRHTNNLDDIDNV